MLLFLICTLKHLWKTTVQPSKNCKPPTEGNQVFGCVNRILFNNVTSVYTVVEHHRSLRRNWYTKQCLTLSHHFILRPSFLEPLKDGENFLDTKQTCLLEMKCYHLVTVLYLKFCLLFYINLLRFEMDVSPSCCIHLIQIEHLTLHPRHIHSTRDFCSFLH